MNIKSVPFPTDLSYYYNTALAYASALAAESGATLHILHVDDLHDVSSAMAEVVTRTEHRWIITNA